MSRSLCVLLALGIVSVPPLCTSSSAQAGTIERVSVASDGAQANNYSWGGTISADGRFVAFLSGASNLAAGDTNGCWDVFVHDRETGATERVSVASDGSQGNGSCYSACISGDGMFVAFSSSSSNLVPGDSNAVTDVFVHDRITGQTERVSVATDGAQGDGESSAPAISADGRFVAFHSTATNLVPGDTNGKRDVFVRDRLTSTTERASVATDGTQASGDSWFPKLTPDGQFVAFESAAANLVPGDDNMASDIFVRGRMAGTVERIAAAAPVKGYRQPDISQTGQFVTMTSGPEEPEICSCDRCNVFLHDHLTGETTSLDCTAIGYTMCCDPSISADGRYVSFTCINFLGMWGEESHYAFALRLYDRLVGEASTLVPGELGVDGNIITRNSNISASGRYVVFESSKGSLVAGDTNGFSDVFVLDRGSGQPPQPWVAINGGTACTNSVAVALALQFPEDCTEMRFRNEPGDWGPWGPCVYQEPWTLPGGDGVKTVCVQCRNALGAISDEACDDIVLDTTPPTDLSITIDFGAECTDDPGHVQLQFSAADAAFRRFKNDVGYWSPWEENTELPAHGKYWALYPGVGLKTVYFQCRDSCGNESDVVSDSIWVPLFVDVPCEESQRRYVEALAAAGVTSGCSASPPLYCPNASITRGQMAVFLCRAAGKEPLYSETPTFCDVPKTNPYYGWIERIANADSWDGNPPTIGCAVFPCKKYCPGSAVTRDEMAAFLVRATGRQPMPSCSGVFADVAGYWACPYIERLVDSSSWPGGVRVTSGCALNPLRYCPKSPVTRGQMAVFIVRAFGLTD